MMHQLTILSSMAGSDFEKALDRHVEWGLSLLDLKDAILGKTLSELREAEAERAAAMIRARGLSVYCLSTQLFHQDVEDGEEAFRLRHLAGVDHVLRLAQILRPEFIRLLAARTRRRAEVSNAVDYVRSEHPWLPSLYREAADRILDAGFRPTIENETHGCILTSVEEVHALFAATGRPTGFCFTWDIQNLWQMGVFPSVAVYEALRPLIGYVHLKGGQHGDDSRTLAWRSSLEEASWPVVEITRRVVADGVSPVLCLNPSHGASRGPGEDFARRDIGFLRRAIPEVE